MSEKGLEGSQVKMQGLQGATVDIITQWNILKQVCINGLIQAPHIYKDGQGREYTPTCEHVKLVQISEPSVASRA